MANSDKNIRITTSKNKTTYPNIVFTGSAAGSSVITLEVLDDNTLSFTSNEGQVFSIDSNLSTGTIWAVSDISGIPLLSASAGGTIGLGVYGGLVAIGQTNPIYKLDLKGSFGLASSNDSLYNFIFSNSAASGSNSLQIRSANSLLLYNSGNTFYTGFKSNAATNITYTLPPTDGSADQFLQTNGSGVLTWATATGSGGTGSTTGVGQGGQYEMAYYPGTGLSVVGSNTFTNNTATGVVSITHSTVSTDSSSGAFKVTGGVGIGGSLYVGGIGASITGVTFSNSTITRGTWNGTNISTTYGGTGQNLGSASGVLTISSGTVSASTTSSAIASALSDETGSGSLVFNSSPSFGTGVTTSSATFAVFNTIATTINAFGAATAINFGASTGKATFNSTDNSTSSTTGALVVSGGAGFAKSISVAGRLQLLNGANYTAFVSSGTGNTVYILPATTPATGTSFLQSDSIGNLSWVGIASGSGSATTAQNIQISNLGSPNSFHPVLMTPNQSSVGSAISSNGTVVYNPSTDIFYTPGLAVTSGVDSSNTTSGAFQVRGGIGVTGTGYFDVVRTRALVTTGDVTVAGNFVVNGSTIDFGNATTDSISFIGRVDTNINPITNNTYDLGSPALAYRNASFGSSIYFTNTTNTNILAFTAGATGTTLTYVLPIDTPTAGQVLAASAISGGSVTLSWEDDQTGAPAGGITTLNTLTAASQSFQTGTTGTDFAISSAVSTHTFNLPDAGSSARGVVSTGTQTLAGAKTFSSALSVTDATLSTSSSTGALKVTGGVGIGGSLYVANASEFESSVASIGVGSGAVVVTGGVGIGGSLNVGGASRFSSSTTATSVGTGALTVTGGAGIAGSLYVGEASRFTSSIAAISSGTGALTVTGGVGIGGSLYVAAASEFEATTAAIDVGSGAVVVTGGVGIGGSLFVGGASRFSSTLSSISVGTGALIVSGGAGIAGSIWAGGISAFTSNTASVSTGTGAVVITGGLGVGGAIYSGTAVASSISGVVLNNQIISTGTWSGTVITSLYGGTGFNSYTIGDLLVASTGTSLAKLPAGDTNFVLTSNGTGTVPSWKAVPASAASSVAVSTTAVDAVFYPTVVNSASGSGLGLSTVNTIQINPARGTFAAVGISAGTAITVVGTAAAINTTTGALQAIGGVGIGGSLYVGGASRFSSSTTATSVGTGALTVTGGAGIAGSLYVGEASRFTSSTASVSSGTGALTVTGGVGIGGSLYVANASEFESSAAAINVGSGAIVVTGGVGIGGSLYVGGASRFESNTNSTTPGVGGLIATGGVGIGLSASIGGRLQMFNSSLYTAFVGAQSGVNTTYTLPTTSPATGSSVLQSTSGGVMSWVPMTSGGSASPGGVVDGSIQFKSGSSFGGTRSFLWTDLQKYLRVSGYPGGELYASGEAALIVEQNYGSFNGSVNGTLIAANSVSAFTGSLLDLQVNAVSKFRIDYTGAVTVGAYVLPTVDGLSGYVLKTNGAGTVTWQADNTGSAGAGSGTVAVPGAQYQVAAYYYSATGASVSGSNTFTNNTSTGVVEISHTTESTSTTSGAFQVDGGAGIAKSLFVGTTLSVGTTPSYNIPNNLASFVSTVNSYNQLVIQNKSNGTAASANLVVNNNASTDSATYGEIGMNSSTFTGSGALNAANAVYLAAHTAPLVLGTVTAHPIRFTVNSGATDTIYIHEAGTAISVYTSFDLRSQNKIRFFNPGNTFRTDLHAGANTASYALALPTAPVGFGYSVLLVDISGNMYFAPVGAGLASTVNNASTPFLRAKTSLTIQFCAGYTPTSAGADSVTIKIPESATDGVTDVTFRLREFDVRVETPSSGPSRIQLEKFTGTGALTYAATGSSLLGGFGITLTGAAIYTTSVPSVLFAGTHVTSNDKLRLNWTLLNATHANFSVQLTLEEV